MFVQRILSKMDPKTAVARIQQQGGLMHPGCGPLLGLLDALGCTRQGPSPHAQWRLLKTMCIKLCMPSCCLKAPQSRGINVSTYVLVVAQFEPIL